MLEDFSFSLLSATACFFPSYKIIKVMHVMCKFADRSQVYYWLDQVLAALKRSYSCPTCCPTYVLGGTLWGWSSVGRRWQSVYATANVTSRWYEGVGFAWMREWGNNRTLLGATQDLNQSNAQSHRSEGSLACECHTHKSTFGQC